MTLPNNPPPAFAKTPSLLRRFFEGLLAGMVLLALSPLFLAVAIGIRLASPGPILYRARRIGLNGTPYQLYKFRSMRIEKNQSSRITGANDSRIFPFGAWLRKLKIDELPQLLNIVMGQMAFVGPRPEDPWIVERFYSHADRETLSVLPGLTSPGSIYYYTQAEHLVDSLDPEQSYVQGPMATKLSIDRIYVRKASLQYDLEIVARTAWVLLCMCAGRRKFPELPEMKFLAAGL